MLEILEHAVIDAGRTILEIYRAGHSVTLKQDASPVTEADERAETIILQHLQRAFPDIPVIAEESVAAGRIPDTAGKAFFLVDPLDGTKEFINRNDDFTVNIALIRDGIPVAGIVYAPAKGVAYAGADGRAEKIVIDADFAIVSRHPIATRKVTDKPVAVASRSHNSAETDDYLRDRGITGCRSIGSSLKFCLLAEGDADLYPRFTRTMEWDTAAGDAVLRNAGGMTLGLDGHPLRYGKTRQPTDVDYSNPHFVASGKRS